MTTKTWASFGAFTSLEQELHALLDRIGARPWLEGFGWRPDTDIYRQGGDLVVEVELPCVDPAGDLSVEVEGTVLRISGSKRRTEGVDERDRFVTERRFGQFERTVMLPDGVDPGAVRAEHRAGLLTVRVPLPPPGPAGGTKVAPIPVRVPGDGGD